MRNQFEWILCTPAAAFDNRISALIADSGIHDMAAQEVKEIKQGFSDPLNTTREDVFEFIRENKDDMNKGMYVMMNNSTGIDWSMANCMFVFDVVTPADVMPAYNDYNLEEILEKIQCPTLICD